MICSCSCRKSVCDYEGNERCAGCGAKNPRKLLSYIDPADYTVVLGEVYWRRGFNNFNETKILDKQVMIK